MVLMVSNLQSAKRNENGMKKMRCWIFRSGESCFGSGAQVKRNGSVAISSSTPISFAIFSECMRSEAGWRC